MLSRSPCNKVLMEFTEPSRVDGSSRLCCSASQVARQRKCHVEKPEVKTDLSNGRCEVFVVAKVV